MVENTQGCASEEKIKWLKKENRAGNIKTHAIQ